LLCVGAGERSSPELSQTSPLRESKALAFSIKLSAVLIVYRSELLGVQLEIALPLETRSWGGEDPIGTFI
jgi:hypothetical protein